MADQREDQGFLRILSSRDVLALGVGAIIGFSWVVLTGSWIKDAGAVGAVAAFLVGGLVMALIGLTYAELVSAMPKAGGEHVYSWRALGPKWSFVCSWGLLLGYVSVALFEAVALGVLSGYIIPDYGISLWTVAGSEVNLIWVVVGAGGAIIITALNYIGVKPSAIFQTIAVVVIVAAGLLMLIGGASGGSLSNLGHSFTGTSGFIAVLVITPFLYLGFDVIPQSAEEINVPYRRVGQLIIFSIVVATVFYCVMIVGTGLAPSQGPQGETQYATANAMAALFNSPVFGDLLILAGLAGILTSWNGLLVGASRLMFSMGETNMLPAWFAKIHPKFRTPGNAILLIGALSVLAPLFGEGMLGWTTSAGSLGVVIAYLLVTVSFLVLRRKEPEMQRPFRAGRSLALGTSALVLAAGLLVLYLPGMPGSLAWPQEWAIFLLWALFGLALMLRMRVPTAPPAERLEKREEGSG